MQHNLSDDDKERYSRHLLLEGFGTAGQQALSRASVLLVGAGGLGSPVALYLAAAGIGHLHIVDYDIVEPSNLQRQVLHFTSDIGRAKADSAAEKLRRLNPQCRITASAEHFNPDNADSMVSGADFVVDGSDSLDVKFLLNDACVRCGKPFSLGGVLGYGGQLMTHVPGSACYRCLFEAPPPSEEQHHASETGIFAPVAALFGSLIASEAIKYFTGIGELLTNRLLSFDALTNSFQTMRFAPSECCPLCGGRHR